MWHEIWLALTALPQRVWDALRDPIRRRHVVVQVGMVWGASWAATGRLWASLGTVGLYFVAYEFVLEPVSKWLVSRGRPSLVGPYWERGMQDGEEFIYP